MANQISLVNVKVKLLPCVRLFVIPWTVAYQAPPSMGFSRQEYWNGLSFPSPVDLPNPEIEPGSPALWADSLPTELLGKPHPHSKQIVIFLYIYYKYICITNLNIIDIEIFSYKFILKIFNKILDLFGLDL